jgi:GTP cyclohydrolase II
MANQILDYFAIQDLQLLTNNPDKLDAISSMRQRLIIRKPLSVAANCVNHHYLLTKNRKFGHSIDVLPPIESMS